jgi:hypothetical protein
LRREARALRAEQQQHTATTISIYKPKRRQLSARGKPAIGTRRPATARSWTASGAASPSAQEQQQHRIEARGWRRKDRKGWKHCAGRQVRQQDRDSCPHLGLIAAGAQAGSQFARRHRRFEPPVLK